MEKVLTQISEDLDKISSIVRNGDKYSVESIEAIQKRIKVNSNIALSKKEVRVGEWCQAFLGREPIYAKISSISKDNFATLEGVYNYDQEDCNKKVPNSFPLDCILAIDSELGRMLEFCNGNHKVMGGL